MYGRNTITYIYPKYSIMEKDRGGYINQDKSYNTYVF